MPAAPAPLTLARHCMATRFELVLHGLETSRLRAAGEEALDEVDRLERMLSLYRSDSEIALLNTRAYREAIPVSWEVFRLLEHARRLWEETQGAFDPTIGPLMRCWGLMHGHGKVPDEAALAEARSRTGMQLVHLDDATHRIRFEREGVTLDLGAIGKGYAVAQAVRLLQEAGVPHALMHGGTSTVHALGCQPDGSPWKVAIEIPPRGSASLHRSPDHSPLAILPLHEESLSVSGVWGRCFESGGRTYGHLLDPRTGQPAQDTVLAAVALPSPTETDALSTALLVEGIEGHARLASLRPAMRSLVVQPSTNGWRTALAGITLLSTP